MRLAKYLGDVIDAQISWGNHTDPRNILEVKKLYEVTRVSVHTSHTKIFLKDFPGKSFNSVWFDLDISEDIAAWKPGYSERDL